MPIHPENTRPAYLDVAGQQWTEEQRFLARIIAEGGILVGAEGNVGNQFLFVINAGGGLSAYFYSEEPGSPILTVAASVEHSGQIASLTNVNGSGLRIRGVDGKVQLDNEGYSVLLDASRSTSIPGHNVAFSDLPGTFVIVGDSTDPPAADAMGKVSLTAQAAAIAATNLTSATPAGLYEVSYYASCTTANAVDGTIGLRLAYTDRVGATTQSAVGTLSLAAVSTGTTALKGVMVVYLASGNITYETVLVGGQTTSRYALEVRCKYLG